MQAILKKPSTDVSPRELSLLRQAVEPGIRRLVLDNPRTQGLERKDANELVAYWTSLATGRLAKLRVEQDIRIGRLDGNLLGLALADNNDWNRGIGRYSEISRVDLGSVIGRRVGERGKMEILDIGCGSATFLVEVGQKFGDPVGLYGLSNSEHRGVERVNFSLGLAELLPDAWTDKFDLVTCFESSMYFWNPVLSFSEACRVTKPGGLLIYGYGPFRPDMGLNYEIMEQVSEWRGREAERCSSESDGAGMRARHSANFKVFGDWAEKSVADERFSLNGREFLVSEVNVRAWCPSILRVRTPER
jgi:SAM-dependent methyltransferase